MADWSARWEAQTGDGERHSGQLSLGGYFSAEAAGRHALQTAVTDLGAAARTITSLTIAIQK